MQDNSWISGREWSDLARRETLFLAVILGFVPLMLFALMLATAIWGDVPPWFGLLAGLGGIAAFYAASVYVSSFRCPGCGERFNESALPTTKQCAHCHIERGTVGVPRSDQGRLET